LSAWQIVAVHSSNIAPNTLHNLLLHFHFWNAASRYLCSFILRID
jgi:hypothetical protein